MGDREHKSTQDFQTYDTDRDCPGFHLAQGENNIGASGMCKLVCQVCHLNTPASTTCCFEQSLIKQMTYSHKALRSVTIDFLCCLWWLCRHCSQEGKIACRTHVIYVSNVKFSWPSDASQPSSSYCIVNLHSSCLQFFTKQVSKCTNREWTSDLICWKISKQN